MNDFIEMKPMAGTIDMQVGIMPTEFFVDAYKFFDIIEKLEKVIMFIEDEMELSIRERG